MALMPLRCTECKSRFYAAAPTPKCQSCAGTHDPFKQAVKDAKAAKKANRRVRKKPQTVDPRAGQQETPEETSE